MKFKLIYKVLLLGVVFLLLSGCAAGPRAESTPGISADEEYVYIAYRQQITQLDITDGSLNWSYPEKANAQLVFYAPPLIDQEFIYFGDFANDFQKTTSSNPFSNEWINKSAKGWYQAKAAKADELILAPNTDRNVYAFDLSGTLIWKHEDQFAFIAEPLIVNDQVILSSQDHEVVFLNLRDGKETASIAMQGAVISTPVYDERTGYIFVGSLGKELVAINPDSATLVWKIGQENGLSSIWSTPILIEDQLIFTDQNGTIFSVDPKTGSENWNKVNAIKISAWPAKVDEEKFVVAYENGEVVLFNKNGDRIWSENLLETSVYTSPVVSGEILLVGSVGKKTVYAFNIDGDLLWSYPPEK